MPNDTDFKMDLGGHANFITRLSVQIVRSSLEIRRWPAKRVYLVGSERAFGFVVAQNSVESCQTMLILLFCVDLVGQYLMPEFDR